MMDRSNGITRREFAALVAAVAAPGRDDQVISVEYLELDGGHEVPAAVTGAGVT